VGLLILKRIRRQRETESGEKGEEKEEEGEGKDFGTVFPSLPLSSLSIPFIYSRGHCTCSLLPLCTKLAALESRKFE
jgi:hypothetical protein